MSRWLPTIAVVLAGVTAAPVVAAAGASGPSQTQIAAALANAERSSDLWATVNVCNTRRYRDVIGIRAQQPALGFSTTMSVRIEVEYWTGTAYKRDPATGATRVVRLGTVSQGTRQGGWNFQFGPHAGRLRGLVQFQWTLDGKLIGSTTRATTGGHKGVQSGYPAGHSADRCVIG